MMTKVTTIMISLLVFTHFSAKAQLYSSGNNVISGNNVGVNTNSPSGSIHVKERMVLSGGLGAPGQTNNTWVGFPMIRFHSQKSIPGGSIRHHYWDITSDGSNQFKLRFQQTGSGAVSKFMLSPDQLYLNMNELRLGNVFFSGKAITPNSTMGNYLSLGIYKYGSSWQGKGAMLMSNEAGNLYFLTNTSGSAFSSLSDFQNRTQMSLSSSGTLHLKGRLQIGNIQVPSGFLAAFDGNIIAEKYVCKSSGNWPDYVFGKNYNLRSLYEVEQYVKANSHLPEVPSAEEVAANGVDLEAMNKVLLKKVEELTLYLIDVQKQLDALKAKQQ